MPDGTPLSGTTSVSADDVPYSLSHVIRSLLALKDRLKRFCAPITAYTEDIVRRRLSASLSTMNCVLAMENICASSKYPPSTSRAEKIISSLMNTTAFPVVPT